MVLSASTRPNHRLGTALVEFAIVASLLFVPILGIIEFGRMMMVQEILINGAREGARRAVLSGSTDTEVYQTVDNYLNGATIQGHTRTVSPSLASARSGDAITVTVNVSYDNVTWLPGECLGWLKGRQLTASAVMRKE